jgi:hypothetical protein
MLHFGSMFILGLWGSSKKIIGPLSFSSVRGPVHLNRLDALDGGTAIHRGAGGGVNSLTISMERGEVRKLCTGTFFQRGGAKNILLT